MRLKAKGMAQNELARRAGLSSSGMSTIINGAYDPRLSSLQMIASVLQCTVGDLLEETKDADGPLTITERRLLDDFRSLNDQGQQYILQTLYTVCAAGIYKKPADVPGMENIIG